MLHIQSIQDIHKIPLYTLFIFILIISANFLAQLFPCRFQKALNENMYLKHIFGLLTLNFFVTLTLPDYNSSLYETFRSSSLLYLLFLIIVNIDTTIFYIVMILLGISYLIYLNMNIIQGKIDALQKDKDINETDRDIDTSIETDPILNKHMEYYQMVSTYINITSIILIIIGFIVYLGKKKYEYKSNFRYIDFLFGHPTCLNKSPQISYMKSIKYAFS